MLTDAVLAFLHFLAIFVLITLMAAEAVVLRPDLMTPATVRRLSLYDLFYFLSAMVVLATGLLRLFYGAKGTAFYLHNPWFHAKITVFVVIALCSLPPTFAISRWRKQARLLPDFVPTPAEIKKARRWVMIEAHLLILLPLCAVMMARGIGAR
jgi:putative membrane protein